MEHELTNELQLEPDSELAEADNVPFDVEEIRKCKIMAKISRARYGKFQQTDACLLVIQIDFLPFYDVRFKYAEIELRLVKPPQGEQASVIGYEPKRWQGTHSARNIEKGAHAGVNTGVATQAVTGSNAGVDIGVDRTSQYAELRRAWLESEHANTFISWRLCENDVAHEGIPKPLVGALIVSATDQIAIRLKYQVKLSKSANPFTWKAAHARMSKPFILNRASVGEGIGPGIVDVGCMDKETFKLETLAPMDWDL